MEAAGMDLRKWITNNANLMEQWKKENFNVHPVHETVSLGANGTKVLGLSWNNNEDILTTDTKSLLEFVSLDKNTKRFILHAVGKIFDPLGLISPFTVRMKCFLQDLWKEEIQWDDPLPTHIEKEWRKWCEEQPHLRNLKIPRLVLDSTLLEDDVELHSFCDASKKAYGAAIYLTTKSRNGISVKLVTSKSRVAPLNCVTLPRLELLGALVAARLHLSLTDPHSWYHCAGKENPADFLSRGLNTDCLVSNSRWWTGAEFLSDSEFPKNFQQVVPELDYLTEHEKETVVQERKNLPEADRSEETALLNSDSSSILDELLELSNNYYKVINILSYIFRFNYNCRNKSKKFGPLTVAEFKESEIKLIKHAQRSLFDKKEIPSSISNLFPFVDGEGIVRVGVRLENASVPYLHKHPAILPKGSKLSKLYFNSLHTSLFHVGPQGLLNAVRQKFWPLSGRSIARKNVHQCVTCFKSRPILSSQIMGNLPSERVNISSPFTTAGLNLYGPFLVKYKIRERELKDFSLSKPIFKGYMFQIHASTRITEDPVIHFRRNRVYISKGKGLRHLKTQGSNKIDGYCPAEIKVFVSETGACSIKFCKTHLGHRNDIGHLSLTDFEQQPIATKIASKIPFDEILDEIRDSVTDSKLERIHLLTKKTCIILRTAST
ncbi:integrase catalytic domain-containing protein [Trichonephila clavipes]|nr:integrase catalytic domain-containing protein [Trichonephila clavipes]